MVKTSNGRRELDPQVSTNPVRGLVHITGEQDTGKTTFALTCGADPQRIAFIDDDIKTSAMLEELPLGLYVNLTRETEGMKEVQLHEYVLALLEKLRQAAEAERLEGRPQPFDVLVFDNFARFEATFKPYVTLNPGRFRDLWSPKGDIKGAEQWNVAGDYEAGVLAKMLEIAPLVIIITHLKDERRDLTEGKSVKTGKQVPNHRPVLAQKARLRIWLRRNPDGSAVPIGLVLKRFTKNTFVPGQGVQVTNVLPLRLVPCTWSAIQNYWREPMGERVPTETEMPNAFELSLIEGTLTKDQQKMMELSLQAIASEHEEVNALPAQAPVKEVDWQKVDELRAGGATPVALAQAAGLSVPEFMRADKARQS